jgi:hypothetical protein
MAEAPYVSYQFLYLAMESTAAYQTRNHDWRVPFSNSRSVFVESTYNEETKQRPQERPEHNDQTRWFFVLFRPVTQKSRYRLRKS